MSKKYISTYTRVVFRLQFALLVVRIDRSLITSNIISATCKEAFYMVLYCFHRLGTALIELQHKIGGNNKRIDVGSRSKFKFRTNLINGGDDDEK